MLIRSLGKSLIRETITHTLSNKYETTAISQLAQLSIKLSLANNAL